MGCKHSKHAASPTPDGDGDGDAHEFFDAQDTLLAMPSFMRAKSLTRLKSANDEKLARGGSLARWKSALGPVETQTTGDMAKCVVPVFEAGMETLADEAGDASWSENLSGEGFKLRGKTYKQDKKKTPSGEPFYNVKGVLSFKSDEKVGDWIKNLFADDLGKKIKGQVPSVIIVNIMVPDYKPTGGMFAKKENDGPGHNVVLLCKISDFARKTLEETEDWETLPADFKLLIRYVKGDGTGKVDTHPHELAVRQQTKMVVMVVAGNAALPWIAHGVGAKGNGFFGHGLIHRIAEAFAHYLIINALFIAPFDHRHIHSEMFKAGSIEALGIPLIGIRFWRHMCFNQIVDHLITHVFYDLGQVVGFHDIAPLGKDHLALVVHHIVKF